MNEQATIGELRTKITWLEEQEQKYLSEPWRAEREKRRGQLIGRWCLQVVHTRGLQLAIPPLEFLGDEAWLFSDEALQADGYVSASDRDDPKVWHWPRQS